MNFESDQCHRILSILNFFFFAGQLMVNYISDVGSVSRANPTLLTPASFTFAIWGVLYLLLLLNVLYECCYTPPSHSEPIERIGTFRFLFLLSCVFNALWVVLFTNGWIRWSFPIILLLWFILLQMYLIVSSQIQPLFLLSALVTPMHFTSKSWLDYFCRRVPFAMYFAWTSAATLINLCASLNTFTTLQVRLFPSVGMLAVFVVGILTAMVLNADLVFALVGLWYFFGLFVKTTANGLEEMQTATVEAMIIVGIVVVLSVLWSCCCRKNYQHDQEGIDAGLPIREKQPGYGTTASS